MYQSSVISHQSSVIIIIHLRAFLEAGVVHTRPAVATDGVDVGLGSLVVTSQHVDLVIQLVRHSAEPGRVQSVQLKY